MRQIELHVGGLLLLIAAVAPAAALDMQGFAAVEKLDELIETLPAGRYHVVRNAIDAEGKSLGQPKRDVHICQKKAGAISSEAKNFITVFDLQIMGWKTEGAKCKVKSHIDDQGVLVETFCPTTEKMDPPTRWHAVEPTMNCKITYTESGRSKSCSQLTISTTTSTSPKPVSSNHYMTGAMVVPGKSARLHMREFDTSATLTSFISGTTINLTYVGACEPGDGHASSFAD
jgi:hypothetical protein